MNLYTKLGFLVFGVLMIAWMLQGNFLGWAVVTALVIAIATLKTTWLIIFSITQLIGVAFRFVGDVIGFTGEVVKDGSLNIKRKLVQPVPYKVESSDEPLGSPFLTEQMELQNP